MPGVHSCPFALVSVHGLAVLGVSVQESVETERRKKWRNSWSTKRCERETGLSPSVRLYLNLPLLREEESEERSKSSAQVRDLPSARCWQDRNWDPLQSSAGWVEPLSQ